MENEFKYYTTIITKYYTLLSYCQTYTIKKEDIKNKHVLIL